MLQLYLFLLWFSCSRTHEVSNSGRQTCAYLNTQQSVLISTYAKISHDFKDRRIGLTPTNLFCLFLPDQWRTPVGKKAWLMRSIDWLIDWSIGRQSDCAWIAGVGMDTDADASAHVDDELGGWSAGHSRHRSSISSSGVFQVCFQQRERSSLSILHARKHTRCERQMQGTGVEEAWMTWRGSFLPLSLTDPSSSRGLEETSFGKEEGEKQKQKQKNRHVTRSK